MDELANIENQLVEELSGQIDTKEKTKIISKYDVQIKWATFCQGRAQALGIKKLPAIVIDESHVFYGVNSVDDAVYFYHQEVADEK